MSVDTGGALQILRTSLASLRTGSYTDAPTPGANAYAFSPGERRTDTSPLQGQRPAALEALAWTHSLARLTQPGRTQASSNGSA